MIPGPKHTTVPHDACKFAAQDAKQNANRVATKPMMYTDTSRSRRTASSHTLRLPAEAARFSRFWNGILCR